MKPLNRSTGLDGGATQLAAVTLSRKGNGYAVKNFGRISTLDPIHDSRFNLTFKEFCKEKSISPVNLVAGLSGNSVMVRYIKVPVVPDWKLDMMMEFEIDEQTNAFTKDSYCDYRKVDIPGIRNHNVMMIGVGTRDFIEYYLENIPHIHSFNLNSLALYSASFLLDKPIEEEQTAVLLDIGADNTEIVIMKGQALLFARNIQYGGHNFDQDIVTALNVDISLAETMKIEKGRVIPPSKAENMQDDPEFALYKCLTASARMLFTNVTSAVQYCRDQVRYYNIDIDRILITGGTSRLKGLDEFLSERLKVPVEPLTMGQQLDLSGLSEEKVADFKTEMHLYTTAIGLAVSSMHEKGAIINPMPQRIIKRRRFFAREFYLIVAAIFFIVSLFLWGWYIIAENLHVGKGIEDRKNLIEDAKALESKITDEELLYSKYLSMEEALKSRVYSSTDMLQVFSILQTTIPEDIWITEFSTEDIGGVNMEGKGSSKKVKKDPKDTLQNRGTIYISGQVRVNGKTPADPHQLLDDYTQRLKKEYSQFSAFIPMEKKYSDPGKKDKFYYKYKVIISNKNENTTQ